MFFFDMNPKGGLTIFCNFFVFELSLSWLAWGCSFILFFFVGIVFKNAEAFLLFSLLASFIWGSLKFFPQTSSSVSYQTTVHCTCCQSLLATLFCSQQAPFLQSSNTFLMLSTFFQLSGFYPLTYVLKYPLEWLDLDFKFMLKATLFIRQ